MRRVDCCSLGEAGMLLERVDGDLGDLAILDVLQSVNEDVEVYSVWGIKIELVTKRCRRLLWRERFVERILHAVFLSWLGHVTQFTRLERTIDKMTTQGKFNEATIAIARDVLPEPELPATPMMLALPHGGS